METPVYMMLIILILRMQQVSKASVSCPPSAPTITYVNSCPQNKTEWDLAAERKKCNLMAAHQNCTDAAKFQYHCLLNHHRNATLEVCAPIFYLQGFCASYNTERIDIVENYEPGFECLKFSGDGRCPNRYPSSEAYKYLRCYDFQIDTKSTTAIATVTTTAPVPVSMPWRNDGMDTTCIAIIVTLSIALLAVILFLISLRYRTKFCSKGMPVSTILLRCIRKKNPKPDTINLEEDIEERNGLLLYVREKDPVEHSQREMKQVEIPEYAIIQKPKKKEALEKAAAIHEINCGKESNKLKELLKYPVHILKLEVDVKDLKEKIVIHSKSIKEHFTAPMISDLQDVQSLDDYNRLHNQVVFTLLQSFCSNIKPPSREWGYEPPSNEITVGADIERIRCMWNSFCNDDLEFPQLDDVYNRMRQKYGTVTTQGDDGVRESHSREEDAFAELKDKIPSITLHPDCYNEEGIIITDSIVIARNRLQARNVVILKGAIGCGKTYALKAIHNHFKGNIWNTAWIQEEELGNLHKFPAKTILLCDNLFGRLGCHAFSKCDIEKIEKKLNDIENDLSENLKVVIAIHQHVFEEVKKSCPLNLLQNKNLSIDMDKLSDAEELLIFKEQQTEGHCKVNHGCRFEKIDFSSVLSKLSKSPGQVGSPFLSLMYCYFHDLFSDDDFTKNPVQSLVKRLNTMRKDSHKDYSCLVYLMCVQNQSLDKELEPWAGSIDAEITESAIDSLNKHKPGYIYIEKKNATLIHDVLTIALFKSAAEAKEDFLPVVQYCRLYILPELMRPSGDNHFEFYTSLVNAGKHEDFNDVGKRLVYRLAKTFGKDWEHPLQSEELFKVKYTRYITMTGEPKLSRKEKKRKEKK